MLASKIFYINHNDWRPPPPRQNATGFLSSHSGNPICPHTNGSRVSLSFIVWFIALWTRRLRSFTWDAFGLYLSSFTLEAHCKSLVDLGSWDCIQFPLYVIVGEKSAVASGCKLMESKLTGFPAAALRLYFGGKGGVFHFPLKLVNKYWPSKIVYINNKNPPSPLPPSPNLIDKILLILGRATWRNSSLG